MAPKVENSPLPQLFFKLHVLTQSSPVIFTFFINIQLQLLYQSTDIPDDTLQESEEKPALLCWWWHWPLMSHYPPTVLSFVGLFHLCKT